MADTNIQSPSPKLLGLSSLIALVVGIALSQVSLVGVLQGVGLVGHQSIWWLGAAFVAALLLAMSYAASFAELALMLPKAGGLGSYTEVALGQLPALIATYSGYVVVNMFGVSAELIIFDRVLREVLQLNTPPNLLALGVLAAVTFLNLRGTDMFAKVQDISTWIKVALIGATVAVLCLMPLPHAPVTTSLAHAQPWSTSVSLFFWCFVAAEFVCPLLPETRHPQRTTPRAMFWGLLLLALLNGAYAMGALAVLPAQALANSALPHMDYANAVFGKVGPAFVCVFGITATVGLLNGVMASVSRMLFDMARHRQAIPLFAHQNARHGTPDYAIIGVALLCGLPLLWFGNQPETIMTLVVAASGCWLLAYIVAHLNVIVLRLRRPQQLRPYRSPLYLLPQVLGIAGMVMLLATNPPEVQRLSGTVLAVVGVLSILWVKFAMKKPLFKPEPIDHGS